MIFGKPIIWERTAGLSDRRPKNLDILQKKNKAETETEMKWKWMNSRYNLISYQLDLYKRRPKIIFQTNVLCQHTHTHTPIYTTHSNRNEIIFTSIYEKQKQNETRLLN